MQIKEDFQLKDEIFAYSAHITLLEATYNVLFTPLSMRSFANVSILHLSTNS